LSRLEQENSGQGAILDRFDLKGKTFLVTGGAGFIGSHVVDGLLASGAKVRVLDNFSTGRRENLSHCLERIELREGDIREARTCLEACQGVDYVSHQAALGSVPRSMKDPATSIDVNVTGTANIFMAARDAGVERVVFASSSSVYGDSEKLPKKEGEEGKPLSPYAFSKAAGEKMAEVFGKCFAIRLTGLRYFNVYGARQNPEGPYAAVIPRFFKAYLGGEPPVIYGDGEQSRDFTYVDNVIRANLLALTAPPEAFGRVYNIAGGSPVKVNELAAIIGKICGREDLKPVHEPPRQGDVAHSEADLENAGMIGYAGGTTIREGLEMAAPYYKELYRPR